MKLLDTTRNFEQKPHIPAMHTTTVYLQTSWKNWAEKVYYGTNMASKTTPPKHFLYWGILKNIYIYLPIYPITIFARETINQVKSGLIIDLPPPCWHSIEDCPTELRSVSSKCSFLFCLLSLSLKMGCTKARQPVQGAPHKEHTFFFFLFFPRVPAPLATTPSTRWRSAGQKIKLKWNKINGMEPPDPQQ